ncbi:MAG TPA: DUF4350 domain-containing protein [Solirubrobacteraceae bacterium]
MSTRAKTVVVVLAVAVGVDVALQAIDRLSGGRPGGPTSSSYATAETGLGAYAELLARAGHPVERARHRAAGADLAPGTTVVVLDPDAVDSRDRDALKGFLDGGGRLVAGGRGSAGWLGDVIGGDLAQAPAGAELTEPLAPVPEVAGVRRVASAGDGGWTETGTALPVLGGARTSLLATAGVDSGRALLLADASPLQNHLLAHEDNAALGLALAGAKERPVVFLEAYHGYGQASGFDAIPNSWLVALGLLVAAALVFILARGRRLGPPELAARELPPPRREYVESLGATLARTRRPAEAVEPVVRHVRSEVARRGALADAASAEDLVAAATRLGIAPDDARAVLAPGSSVDVLAAGRALAVLERRG